MNEEPLYLTSILDMCHYPHYPLDGDREMEQMLLKLLGTAPQRLIVEPTNATFTILKPKLLRIIYIDKTRYLLIVDCFILVLF